VEFPIPTCNTMSDLVTDYLERTLPLRARFGVRMHLFACRACDNYYGQTRDTIRLMQRGVLRASTESVEDAVLARLAKQPQGNEAGRMNGPLRGPVSGDGREP